MYKPIRMRYQPKLLQYLNILLVVDSVPVFHECYQNYYYLPMHIGSANKFKISSNCSSLRLH